MSETHRRILREVNALRRKELALGARHPIAKLKSVVIGARRYWRTLRLVNAARLRQRAISATGRR